MEMEFTDEFNDFAQGIDIGTRVGLLPFDQLRSDEFVFFDKQFAVGFILCFWKSDIDDFSPKVVCRNDDVFRFEVAVDDAALVHKIQAIAKID